MPAQFSHPSGFGMEPALVEPPPSGTLPPVHERWERENQQKKGFHSSLHSDLLVSHLAVSYIQDQKHEAHKKRQRNQEKQEKNVSALVVWAEVHSIYALQDTRGRRIKPHTVLQPITPVDSFHYFTCWGARPVKEEGFNRLSSCLWIGLK